MQIVLHKKHNITKLSYLDVLQTIAIYIRTRIYS